MGASRGAHGRIPAPDLNKYGDKLGLQGGRETDNGMPFPVLEALINGARIGLTVMKTSEPSAATACDSSVTAG